MTAPELDGAKAAMLTILARDAHARGETDAAENLLASSLEAAVPFLIEDMRTFLPEERERVAHESAQIITEKGDRILYRSKVRGETARAWKALARGLAALAFAPGGVRFLGLRFDAALPFPHCERSGDATGGDTARTGKPA